MGPANPLHSDGCRLGAEHAGEEAIDSLAGAIVVAVACRAGQNRLRQLGLLKGSMDLEKIEIRTILNLGSNLCRLLTGLLPKLLALGVLKRKGLKIHRGGFA